MRVKDWYANNLGTYLDLELRAWVGDTDETPVVGLMHESREDEWATTDADTNAPVFLRVPCTTWGDHTGSLFDRSNYNCFVRDYPNTFIRAVDMWDNRGLLLPWDAELDTSLGDAILNLENYPLYDEDHHSELRHSLAVEAFNERQFDGDYVYTINELIHEDAYTMDVLRRDFQVTDQWLKDQFWAFIRSTDDCEWIVEDSATEVYVSGTVIERAAESVIDTLVADWNAKVTWLTDRQEGLF